MHSFAQKDMRAYFNKIYLKGSEAFEKEMYENLLNERKTFIVTANPETLMIGQKNKEFDEVLRSDHVTIVPDGIGVVKAAKILDYSVDGRVTGVELSQKLLEYADKEKKSIYLFGAKPNVLQLLVDRIRGEYAGVEICGYTDGYVQDKESVMREIISKTPDIILVALGIPQQELLIAKYFEKASKGIFVGVGGTFDVLSGTKKRAPKIFIRLNLEWLYRIIKEPKRIKRFVKSNVIFIMKVLKMKGGK